MRVQIFFIKCALKSDAFQFCKMKHKNGRNDAHIDSYFSRRINSYQEPIILIHSLNHVATDSQNLGPNSRYNGSKRTFYKIQVMHTAQVMQSIYALVRTYITFANFSHFAVE